MSHLHKTSYVCEPVWYDYTYNSDSDWIALSSDDKQKEDVIIPSNGPYAVDLNISCIIKDNTNPLETEEDINSVYENGDPITVTGRMRISGDGVVSKKLEVSLPISMDSFGDNFLDTDSDNMPDDLSYQWIRQDNTEGAGAEDIPGATENMYQLTSDDVNKYITVRMTYSGANSLNTIVITGPSVGPVEPLTVGEIQFQIKDNEDNWITPEEASYAVGASNLVRLPRANMPEMRIIANGRSVFAIHGAI